MSGYKLEEKYSLSNQLSNKLIENGFNYKLINASIPGETSFGGLNRINWTLSETNIKFVVLCLGANDMLRGIKPKQTYQNLEKIIKNIMSKNIHLIFAGMIAPESYGKNFKNQFDGIFPDLAIKYELTFIPFLLKKVALRPQYNLNDGIHPNEKGIDIISDTILEKLIPLLQK